MITYRAARREDGAALAKMASASFVETFGHLYSRADLDSFLRTTFGPNGLPAQIADPAYTIRIAMDRGSIAGFAKIGSCTLSAPTPPGAAELKQLYVLRPWQGVGVAAALMEWAIATVRERGATHLALSVFSENIRAQRFYARYGLAEIGRTQFRVGEHVDDDRIWSVAL